MDIDRRWPYLVAPLPALVVGTLTIVHLGEGVDHVIQQAAMAATGSVLVCLFGRRVVRSRATRADVAVAAVALGAIASTLVLGGREGVHRWIPLVRFELNASLLLSPLILAVAWRRAIHGFTLCAAVLLIGLQVVHVLQPDAAQASAVAAVAVVAAITLRSSVPMAGIVAGVTVVMAGWSWFRDDPLRGVATVEDIVQAAASWSPMVGAVAVGAVVCLVVPFLVDARSLRDPFDRGIALAFGTYLVALVIASQIGEFPVPVLGYGASTVLGYYAAAAASLWAADAPAEMTTSMAR